MIYVKFMSFFIDFILNVLYNFIVDCVFVDLFWLLNEFLVEKNVGVLCWFYFKLD